MTTRLNTARLADAWGRQVNYLRISVTDQCNLACRYCAPCTAGGNGGDGPVRLPGAALLSFEEICRLAAVGAGLGISKVRLTGGEPLCRPGITRFIKALSGIPGLRDIGLTTNGVRLAAMAPALKAAGLNRINISLDTLNRDRFRQITGRDAWDRVWDGIHTALALGFDPVKVNTVVMKGVNDDEVADLAGLSRLYPLHVRFIEYMPIGPDPSSIRGYFISGEALKKRAGQLGSLIPVARGAFDGPARRFKFKGAPGEIGFISSMSDHFCRQCNRMRLTADGYLRPCLLADNQVALAGRLREGCPDSRLEDLFFKALSMKQPAHGLDFNGHNRLETKMVRIGG